MVLIGTITALAVLSGLAIYFGKNISEKINQKLITKIGGIVFILIEILFLF